MSDRDKVNLSAISDKLAGSHEVAIELVLSTSRPIAFKKLSFSDTELSVAYAESCYLI